MDAVRLFARGSEGNVRISSVMSPSFLLARVSILLALSALFAMIGLMDSYGCACERDKLIQRWKKKGCTPRRTARFDERDGQ